MFGSVSKLERRARYVMGVVAIIAVCALAAFKFGWIATVPSYKHNAWYLVGGTASFVVTSEYADEASCRREENASAICRSGRSLIEQSLAQQNGRS